jgi:ATP-dependent DNA helicase PIF1
MSDELKDYFACFWGMHVTAFNPEPNSGPRPHSEPSILQVPGEFMVNNAISLSSVVNRVQGHIHSRYYCLKTNKNTKVDECRFHLPDELRNKAKLDKHPAVGRDWLWFYPIRNDGMINKYNRLISMAWQANTDISPCTDPKAVLEYVVKYASKAEKKSPAYRDLAGTLIPFVNENRPFQSLVTKMMNKLIGDRDYSAQEVCHYLLDLPLKHATRAFISVDLRPEDQHSHLYRLERDETRRGLSVLEKYKERNAEDEEVTYIDFLKRYSHQRPYSKRP